MALEYDPVTQTFVNLGRVLFIWSGMSDYSTFILLMTIFIVSGIVLMNIPIPYSKYIGASSLIFFAIITAIFAFQMELTFSFRIFGYNMEGMIDLLAVMEIIAILFLLIFIAIRILGGWIGVGTNHWLIIITWVLIIVVQICLLFAPAIIISVIAIIISYVILYIVKMMSTEGK